MQAGARVDAIVLANARRNSTSAVAESIVRVVDSTGADVTSSTTIVRLSDFPRAPFTVVNEVSSAAALAMRERLSTLRAIDVTSMHVLNDALSFEIFNADSNEASFSQCAVCSSSPSPSPPAPPYSCACDASSRHGPCDLPPVPALGAVTPATFYNGADNIITVTAAASATSAFEAHADAECVVGGVAAPAFFESATRYRCRFAGGGSLPPAAAATLQLRYSSTSPLSTASETFAIVDGDAACAGHTTCTACIADSQCGFCLDRFREDPTSGCVSASPSGPWLPCTSFTRSACEASAFALDGEPVSASIGAAVVHRYTLTLDANWSAGAGFEVGIAAARVTNNDHVTTLVSLGAPPVTDGSFVVDNTTHFGANVNGADAALNGRTQLVRVCGASTAAGQTWHVAVLGRSAMTYRLFARRVCCDSSAPSSLTGVTLPTPFGPREGESNVLVSVAAGLSGGGGGGDVVDASQLRCRLVTRRCEPVVAASSASTCQQHADEVVCRADGCLWFGRTIVTNASLASSGTGILCDVPAADELFEARVAGASARRLPRKVEIAVSSNGGCAFAAATPVYQQYETIAGVDAAALQRSDADGYRLLPGEDDLFRVLLDEVTPFTLTLSTFGSTVPVSLAVSSSGAPVPNASAPCVDSDTLACDTSAVDVCAPTTTSYFVSVFNGGSVPVVTTLRIACGCSLAGDGVVLSSIEPPFGAPLGLELLDVRGSFLRSLSQEALFRVSTGASTVTEYRADVTYVNDTLLRVYTPAIDAPADASVIIRRLPRGDTSASSSSCGRSTTSESVYITAELPFAIDRSASLPPSNTHFWRVDFSAFSAADVRDFVLVVEPSSPLATYDLLVRRDGYFDVPLLGSTGAGVRGDGRSRPLCGNEVPANSVFYVGLKSGSTSSSIGYTIRVESPLAGECDDYTPPPGSTTANWATTTTTTAATSSTPMSTTGTQINGASTFVASFLLMAATTIVTSW